MPRCLLFVVRLGKQFESLLLLNMADRSFCNWFLLWARNQIKMILIVAADKGIMIGCACSLGRPFHVLGGRFDFLFFSLWGNTRNLKLTILAILSIHFGDVKYVHGAQAPHLPSLDSGHLVELKLRNPRYPQ